MGFFDIAAQLPAVNVGIERGMKLSEESRKIAVARDQAAADNLEGQRQQADRAGLRLSPVSDMPGLPENPNYFARPAGPSAAQTAAVAPAAGLKPSTAVASTGIANNGLRSENQTYADKSLTAAGLDETVNVLQNQYTNAYDNGAPQSDTSGEPALAAKLAAAKNAAKIANEQLPAAPQAPQVIAAQEAGARAAAGAKAPADNTPAAQALADAQAKAGLAPAAVTAAGEPADGQSAAASAGLATAGSPSAAVAAEGATRFNMEIERAMNTRALVARNAKQDYDQNMFLANKAERYAQIARSVQNMAGYDTHMTNAITYRNQATATHAAAVDHINKIDTAVQTNVLGFAVDRLTNLNDSAYISQVISAQTNQTTEIRESGTLGADGKPTYNTWIQGKSGKWTAISDAKSGKPTLFSAGDIAERAQKMSSASYRSDVAKAVHDTQVEDKKTERKIKEQVFKSRGEMMEKIGIWLSTLGRGYKLSPNPNATDGSLTYQNPLGDIMVFRPNVAAKALEGAPGTGEAVQHFQR